MSSPQQVIQLAQAGRIQEALQLWDRLARQRPRDPNLLALGGNLYGQAGNLDAARRCFKKALKSDKRNVQAHMGMGQLLRTRGEHLEAVKHLRMAHQASPADLGVANNLALSLRESGRAAEGVGILKRYVDKTDHPGTRYNYANLLLAAGDAHAARKQFLRLRDAHPDNASALNGLGMAEFGCGNAQAAMEAFEKALELDPQSLPVLANFARACEQVGAFDRAAEGFQKWLELQPEAYEPRVRLANAYGELQRHEDALELLDRAIGQAPDRPEAYRDKSAILEQINRLEEAWATLEQALDRVGSDPVLALMRGRLLRRRKQPEEAIAALEAEHPESPELQRRRAHELALAHDAAGQFDLAWKRVEDFNRLTSTEPPADPFLDSLVERSEAQGLERLKEAPQASEDGTQAPIFVVGLPRSGTTLLGRILGAHSGVHELEESPYLSELARSVDWPVQPLDEAQRAELRARYFDAFDAQGKRVVDRNPINLIYVPLIRNLWPKATIVYCHRHPGDIALSCLFQDFRINWMTRHFRTPSATVAHCEQLLGLWSSWQDQLDPAAVVMRYEDLVTDPEKAIRSLADACGLTFEPEMIEGRKAAPAAKTASYAQVIEPIHDRSVGRWESYRDHFGESAARIDALSESFGY